MSEANKTRYEIQKAISDTIKQGLVAYIGSSHGFGVMEFAQASFQNADRIILMNPIKTQRVGWQRVSHGTYLSEYKRKDEWIEEQSWQLHTILKKSQNPSISDLQADDVADMLITWINGQGSDVLRSKGIAPMRVAADSVIVYTDDSELYQKRAVFTVKLQVPKELSIGAIEAVAVQPKVKPV